MFKNYIKAFEKEITHDDIELSPQQIQSYRKKKRINKNDIEGIASDESDDLLAIEGDPLSTNEHNHNVNRSDQSEDEQMNELNAFDVDEKANIEDENVQNESNKVVTNGDWIMHELFDEMTPTQINKAKAFINKANKKYHGYLSKRFGDRTFWGVDICRVENIPEPKQQECLACGIMII
eukprot:389640_1